MAGILKNERSLALGSPGIFDAGSTHKADLIGEAAVMCVERIIPFGVLRGDVRIPNVVVRRSDVGHLCWTLP
jgi:hypothetical protein